MLLVGSAHAKIALPGIKIHYNNQFQVNCKVNYNLSPFTSWCLCGAGGRAVTSLFWRHRFDSGLGLGRNRTHVGEWMSADNCLCELITVNDLIHNNQFQVNNAM